MRLGLLDPTHIDKPSINFKCCGVNNYLYVAVISCILEKLEEISKFDTKNMFEEKNLFLNLILLRMSWNITTIFI